MKKNKNYIIVGKKLASFAIVSMSIWGSALAFAQSADDANGFPEIQPEDCSSFMSSGDKIGYATCACRNGQLQTRVQLSSAMTQAAGQDPYLKDMRNVKPGDTASYGATAAAAGAISKGCYGLTKGVFDSALSSLGGFLGFDIGSLLGGVSNGIQGQLCQQVNNAIMSHASFQCPKVKIPGFPVNCSISANVGPNGIGIGTNGQFGGWSAGGNSNASLNGVVSANGNYNMGPDNRASVNTGQINAGNATVVQNAAGTVTGAVSNAANSVACWFTGKC